MLAVFLGKFFPTLLQPSELVQVGLLDGRLRLVLLLLVYKLLEGLHAVCIGSANIFGIAGLLYRTHPARQVSVFVAKGAKDVG